MNPLDIAGVLVVVIGATLAIAWMPSRKEPIAFAAAALVILFGQLRGFYGIDQAFQSISFPVLLIIVSIGIFAEAFSESGFFERVCRRVAIRVRGNRRALVLVFLALTYLASCFLDNLTCLYVLLPVMIGSMRALGMTPAELRPTIVAIVIAGNLGGASTMIGDFPNILIARSQGIAFLSFLVWMMPAGVLLLGVLVLLMPRRKDPAPADPWSRALLVEMIAQQADMLKLDRRLFAPAALLFMLFVGGLIGTGWWPFPPELVAFVFVSLLIWSLPRPQDWVAKIDVRSVLFITCLFIFAGAIRATGALDRAAQILLDLTQGNPYRLSAAVLLLAAVLTALFSAGPTTAALIPAAEAMKSHLPGHMIWWCLSLGVLAGSSATLLSATAGPIAANILRARTGIELSFGDFLRIGWKAMIVFAVLSLGYVWLRL